MERQKQEQEQDLIFALDIGTRSIIGMLGKAVGDRFQVLAIDAEEHGKRAMLDGQIEDIDQVARVARVVTSRLEEKMGRRLTRVCVAAAGRALRTEQASFRLELPQVQRVDDALVSRLEAGAVSEAEAQLAEDQEARRFFLVGYTVRQYQLDHYPLSTLRGHKGQELEAQVVATFLPSEVVESLYAVMNRAGLEVASLTLEPIAAMNAAIPAELRLLNLVLVDIGAGTSDIAVCREGSVVGYTMATVAGDEITEALMNAFLVDFHTAERLKTSLESREPVVFTDILGLEQSATGAQIQEAAAGATAQLVQKIAEEVLAVNGGTPPSALFLAGGGSKLAGLRPMMAQALGMDERRVAVAGNNYQKTAFSDEYDLNNPAYATPLGIAVSAGLGLVSDSCVVTLNGANAKLFRSGMLRILDILLMNGYTYGDLIGRTGENLTIQWDGKRMVFRGEPAVPAELRLNGKDAAPTATVHAGDKIEFTPAQPGQAAARTLGQLLGEDFQGKAWVNGQAVPLETPLRNGDAVTTMALRKPDQVAQEAAAALAEEPAGQPEEQAPKQEPAAEVPEPRPVPALHIMFNDRPLALQPKPDGAPYYLMDLLEYTQLDFKHLDRPVTLLVNGEPGAFTQQIYPRDVISIRCEPEK